MSQPLLKAFKSNNKGNNNNFSHSPFSPMAGVGLVMILFHIAQFSVIMYTRVMALISGAHSHWFI